MHQKFLALAILFVSLAGLMSSVQPAEPVDPENSARVRVYQEADITLYPGEYCFGADGPDTIKAASAGFSIFGTNHRVGMPVTDDIPGSYNEYLIPAGKPVSVMLQWEAEKDGVKASCGPLGSTFYPQAGRDYDITIGYSGNCFVQIRELYLVAPGKAAAKLTPSGPSFACLKR
jgi:hypothetical protein